VSREAAIEEAPHGSKPINRAPVPPRQKDFSFTYRRSCYDAEREHRREIAAMAEEFEHKNVAIVAATIGGVIVLLGLIGILWSS
jgi:hypothetical protein